MSGIAGIARADGKPPDLDLLRKMTKSLSFCGPDAQEIWNSDSVGLGHALLSHTRQTENERQPLSLNDRNWIVADARLDAREELVGALRSRGRDARLAQTDAQLLLQAYDAWGEECLQHLMGDFAFAIWDKPREEFFCACDHFGIKPLYFAEVEGSFVFSNVLDCVRLHPSVSDRLNDAAIADFLLFGKNYDPGSTAFADIRRLPRAHSLRWSRLGVQTREYWRPPTDGDIRYSRPEEYVAQFAGLLASAVEDRLRTNQAGIFLSGGLDSSSIAAIARDLSREKYPALELHAFTSTYGGAIPGGDEDAARTVAEALQIPFHGLPGDAKQMLEHWEHGEVRSTEPIDDPFAYGLLDEFKTIARSVRVVLSGEGSDNLMDFEMGQHLRSLWREGRVSRAFLDLAAHIGQRLRAPDGLRGPLRRVRGLFARDGQRISFPPWIKPNLVERLNLKAHWDEPVANLPWNAHRRHPRGYGSLFLPEWDYLFRKEDPGTTHQPVEVRYPFLDLRVVNYLLAIPAMPWFFRKHLLREAMRGRLPESIRLRPKASPRDSVLPDTVGKAWDSRVMRMRLAEEFEHYIDRDRLPFCGLKMDSEDAEIRMRPACLNFWLLSLKSRESNDPKGGSRDTRLQ